MGTTKEWLELMDYDGVDSEQTGYYVEKVQETCPAIKRAYERYEDAREDLRIIIKGELSIRSAQGEQ